jgi:thiol:disulfide interchange protein DsbC
MIRTVLIAVSLLFIGTTVVIPPDAHSKEPKDDPSVSFRKDYPAVSFESVEKTAIKGLYEIVAGGNVFYYHPESGNILFGEMITKTFANVTAERRNSLMAARLKDLPLGKAIRIGNGKNIVIEFTDVDCPFCRKLEEYFEKRSDVTRYVFLSPIESLHPESTKKSMAVLCAEDRSGTYRDVMKGVYDGKEVPACNNEDAAKMLAEQREFGAKLGVQGTPALWIDNVPVAGANIALIEQLLSPDKEHTVQRKEVKP